MKMEACVRGFSFMAESKADLQFIEGGELERAWRSTRRERLKQREQRIWDNFVMEQDAVQGICDDDPYQFLDPLPESCMKEIMEQEQPPVVIEKTEEEPPKVKEQSQHGTGDSLAGDDGQHTCVVTFADEMDRDGSDMFYIFDDDQSGGEEDTLNESNSPDTVRELPNESARPSGDQAPETNNELKQSSSKSSENVATVIESSIYCARVKEIRVKINEELLALMTSLDRRDILLTSEPEDISRMVKRSAEFCNRFNRIHMYQLQRQIHDIKRNNNQALPFAKHTQFQLQMGRIVTLHQNLLQSFMVFHKSFGQTCCVRESAGALGSLLAAVRDATHMCRNVAPPRDFVASQDLYKDDLLATCDKVDEFVTEYAIRCEEFLNRFESVNSVCSKRSSKKDSKVKKRPWNNKSPKKTGIESQLSMYSMDTRIHFHPKPIASSKGYQTVSSKNRMGPGTTLNLKRAGPVDKAEAPKSTRRSRRPLMRDPNAGQPRAPKPEIESDIQTMVEAVETCASSHMSCSDSPRAARPPRRPPARRAPPAPHTPRDPLLLANLATPRSHSTAAKKPQASPRPTKTSNEPSPTKPKPAGLSPKSTEALKDALNLVKNEQETEEPVIPILTIKCAMKKEVNTEEGETKRSPATRESPKDAKKMCNVTTPDGSQLKLVYKYEDGNQTEGTPRRGSSPHSKHHGRDVERDRNQMDNGSPDRYEVTRLLKQLCSGDGSIKPDRVSGAKNAQLVHVSGSSPRQPSTPQLLRILEETIKKKMPKPLFQPPPSARSIDRYRLQFNIGEKTADALFQYRTKFVQHMLTSAMYANSAVGKPWEMIGNVSEQLIDEILLKCVSKMELRDIIQQLYHKETTCP